MRDFIPFRPTVLDVSWIFGMKYFPCKSYTTTFGDNKGSVELAEELEYRPQKIYIFSIKWYHFRDHIKRGTSKIFYIETNEQQADIMKTPLTQPQFGYLSKQITGW